MDRTSIILFTIVLAVLTVIAALALFGSVNISVSLKYETGWPLSGRNPQLNETKIFFFEQAIRHYFLASLISLILSAMLLGVLWMDKGKYWAASKIIFVLFAFINIIVWVLAVWLAANMAI